MEVAVFLRLVWRRRLRTVIGLAVSVLVGMALAKHVPAYGVATTGVLVDTPQSEIAANESLGMDTLYWRSTLLGMLLGANRARHQIAGDMRVPENQINIADPELGTPNNPASLPVAAIKAATSSTASYTVNAYTDDVLPIVQIAAIAPDGASASRLARATVQALETGASPTSSVGVQGLNIQQIEPIVVRERAASAGHTKMAIVAVAVFMLWCVSFILVPAARRPRLPALDATAAAG